MPSLNFQKQFAPAVKDGTKTHSIRAKRKRPFKLGDKISLFTGMRQKGCERLGDGIVSKIEAISINSRPDEAAVFIQEQKLSSFQVEELAKADGFKTVEDFYYFFMQSHGPSFDGHLIHWVLIERTVTEPTAKKRKGKLKRTRKVFGRIVKIIAGKVMKFELHKDGLRVRQFRSRNALFIPLDDLVNYQQQELLKTHL